MSPVLLYVLIVLGVVALVIAAVAVGPQRFQAAWAAIPGPVRTVVNVGLGAALTAGVSYLVGVLSGSPFDLSAFGFAVWTAVSTAVVRALNPADTAYGVGKTVQGEVLDVTPAPAEDEPGSPA